MIYTVVLVRDSYESYHGGYLDGSSPSDTQIHCFTKLEDLKKFTIEFLIESHLNSEKNREYSTHELSVLVNGIPGDSYDSRIHTESMMGCGAQEEATRLEYEIKSRVAASLEEARTKAAHVANENRLKRERFEKEKKERQEREQLAELISRYGVNP